MKYQTVRKPIVISMTVLFHTFLIFHLMFSPVIIVMASYKGIINASFFSFIIIFILSLFFGRAYCAWFCPGCGIQEIIGFKLKKKAKNTKAVYIKFVLFTTWISTIIVGYILKGFTRIDLSYGMSNISIQKKLILTLGAAIIIVPISVVLGRFASCKYICWHAPFMIIGRRIRDKLKLPGLRIRAAADNCRNCRACTTKCPMNIDVMKKVPTGEIADDECILCGSCIDACKFKVLSYRVCRPSKHC